jgi:hypothetical protein
MQEAARNIQRLEKIHKKQKLSRSDPIGMVIGGTLTGPAKIIYSVFRWIGNKMLEMHDKNKRTKNETKKSDSEPSEIDPPKQPDKMSLP